MTNKDFSPPRGPNVNPVGFAAVIGCLPVIPGSRIGSGVNGPSVSTWEIDGNESEAKWKLCQRR